MRARSPTARPSTSARVSSTTTSRTCATARGRPRHQPGLRRDLRRSGGGPRPTTCGRHLAERPGRRHAVRRAELRRRPASARPAGRRGPPSATGRCRSPSPTPRRSAPDCCRWPGPLGRLRNRVVGAAGRRRSSARRRRPTTRAAPSSACRAPPGRSSTTALSPYLHMQGCTPVVRVPPPPPAARTCTGSVRSGPTRPRAGPSVVVVRRDRAATRPVVHVTQGSIRPDMTELVGARASARSGGRRRARGRDHRRTSAARRGGGVGGALPANVRVATFVPYDAAGCARRRCSSPTAATAGVTIALHHGVPIVQAGDTEEKGEIGARIEWSGVGVRLGTTRPVPTTPSAPRSTGCSPTPTFRGAAGAVAAEMTAHDAGREGADLLEQLAAGGAPSRATDPVEASSGAPLT